MKLGILPEKETEILLGDIMVANRLQEMLLATIVQ